MIPDHPRLTTPDTRVFRKGEGVFRRIYLLLLTALIAATTAALMVASGAALPADQAKGASNKGNDTNSATKESTNLTDTNDDDAVSTTAKKKKIREFAKGSGTFRGAVFGFDVRAKDTIARTAKAAGRFRLSNEADFVEGTLSCLRTARTADGSIAVFAGKVTASTIPEAPVDTFLSFDATDASSGDLLSAGTPAGSAVCFQPTGGTIPVDTGNIEIRPLKR